MNIRIANKIRNACIACLIAGDKIRYQRGLVMRALSKHRKIRRKEGT